MANRLGSREIPLFWTFEELGPLRKKIEEWYSKGVPMTAIIKRACLVRDKEGKRPLICCDVYGVLMDAVRKGALVQRTLSIDEMPVATFFHFFACWKNGGSVADCTDKVSTSIPSSVPGGQPSPKFVNDEVCKRLHRQMSERWRAENRGDVQALIRPRKEALAVRPTMEVAVNHEVAIRIAQQVYDLIMRELKTTPEKSDTELPPATTEKILPPLAPAPLPPAPTLGESPINEEDEQTEDSSEEKFTLDDLASEEDATPLHPIPESPPEGEPQPTLPPLVNGEYDNPFDE